jgi:hypothetical protein
MRSLPIRLAILKVSGDMKPTLTLKYYLSNKILPRHKSKENAK